MLRYRLLTAFVLGPIVLGAAILGGWWLFAVLGVGLLLCGYEYFALLAPAGYRANRWLGLVLIAGVLGDALLQLNAGRLLLVALVVGPPLLELRRQQHDGFLTGWALTALGVVYLGGIGSYVFLLRALPNGAWWLIVTLLATWATDTAAYFVGKSWGRHAFFHEVSPKKTWEGAIGGILGAALVFGVLGTYLGLFPLLALLGGLGVGVAGTFGDLVESFVKRQVGAKDSGSLLLGHGGVWDRLDSMIFAMLFAYYFIVAVHA